VKFIVEKLALTIASGMGSGFSPWAPGTAGSLLAAIVWWLVPQGWWVRGPMLLTSLALGVWSATEAERRWGHDNGKIVVDEIAGMWISLLFLPKIWGVFLISFLVFRAMDIAKPLGARQIQKMPGGWGVVADDVLAGIYANLLGQVAVMAFWPGKYVPLLTIKTFMIRFLGS
jgi:phosphatidylglycerophosphatase A